MSRDTSLGLNFAGVNYYDGQGFMVKKAPGVTSALQLSGASVCVQTGTTTELNLADYFKANKMEYNPVVFEKLEEVNAAYDAGRCDVYTTDASGLYAHPPDARQARRQHRAAGDHLQGAARAGRAPGRRPVVQHREVDCTSRCSTPRSSASRKANVDQMKASENQDIKRLLGVDGTFGEGIGLGNDWAVQHHQGGRQLRRDLRAQCRRRLAAEDRARPERAVDQGRHQYAPPIR